VEKIKDHLAWAFSRLADQALSSEEKAETALSRRLGDAAIVVAVADVAGILKHRGDWKDDLNQALKAREKEVDNCIKARPKIHMAQHVAFYREIAAPAKARLDFIKKQIQIFERLMDIVKGQVVSRSK